MIENSFRIKNKALIDKVVKSGESGMGYHIVTVTTKDVKRYDNVLVMNSDEIAGIYGYDKFPFCEDDIADIDVTHLKKPKDFNQQNWLYLKR